MDSVGDLQTIIKAIERTAQVKVLISFLSKQTIAQDSQSDCLVSSFGVGLVDLDLFFKFNSVLNLRTILS